MRLTLLHNPNAGEEDHEAEDLESLIAAAGHEVRYHSLKKKGWDAVLDDPGDLVVVAGGDGSVGKVFRELATRDVPVTLLPVGSANNVARTLGIADIEVERCVRGWAGGELQRFDVADATARGARRDSSSRSAEGSSASRSSERRRSTRTARRRCGSASSSCVP